MKRHAPLVLLILGVLAAGAALRLCDLGSRSMHADEAVQAIKFGDLLERGEYVYDLTEYHGPALHYLALPVVRAAGVRTLDEVSEALLRLAPALCGTILIGLVWVLRKDLGMPATVAASAFAALSPLLVFYSRYYIAEMPFTCVTLAALVCGWRACRSLTGPAAMPAYAWAVAAGLCAGLMHATKETCVISFAAMAAAAAYTVWAGPVRSALRTNRRRLAGMAAAALATAVCVSVLLFSSFFRDARGPVRSMLTYWHYFGRAAGRADAAWHVHPWHYYLRVLVWPSMTGGCAWTQALVLGLAAFGAVKPGTRTNAMLTRFLAVCAIVTFALYSALPYKTPWCMSGFLVAACVLAGIGAASLAATARGNCLRPAACALVLLALGLSAWQAWRASFVAGDDRTNPYAYVQTTADVPALAGVLRDLAAASGQAVQVICPGHDYWPLPWYLRSLPRVGWHDAPPDGPLAPILVFSPGLRDEIARRVYDGRQPASLYVDVTRTLPGGRAELRPNVPLTACVELALWERYGGHPEEATP